MPASINFSTFTSDTVLFSSKAAANSFFQAMSVSDATITSRGVTLRIALATFSPAAYANENVIELTIDGATEQIASLAHTEAVKTRLEALETAFAALQTALSSAGVLSLT